MSMPAQKARWPAPVSSAQRIASSSRTRRHASANARIVGGSSAFACSGRSIVTTATCGWSGGSSKRTATELAVRAPGVPVGDAVWIDAVRRLEVLAGEVRDRQERRLRDVVGNAEQLRGVLLEDEVQRRPCRAEPPRA